MGLCNTLDMSHGFTDEMLLNKVNFALEKGEHAAVVGVNGAGKTTFMRILTGELMPDSGRVKWLPDIVIGHLAQHARLVPGKSIRNTLREAFQHLYAAEDEMIAVGTSMSPTGGVLTPDVERRAMARIAYLQDILDAGSFYTVDKRVEEVSAGLGLVALGLERPVDMLSGGQRTKVLLALLLLEEPDVLLLDEPTNYLDSEHIEWLVGYLRGYKSSYIVVSHDNSFIERVANVIWNLENGVLKRYPGTYSDFIRTYEMERTQAEVRYGRQQQQISKMEDFIARNIVRASTTGRAQSRRKQLDKIERLQKPPALARPSLAFAVAREPSRVIFECADLEIGYSGPLLPALTRKLEKGQKVAVVGCNGIGKSTLLKTLIGQIPAIGGVIEYGDNLFPVYFEQEVTLDAEITPLDFIWRDFPGMGQREVRKALARSGIGAEHARERMGSLSGGERTRVRLAKSIMRPSNWLLLDEPTNHLDTQAKDALREALVAYTGAIVLVCHEQRFYKGWVSEVWDMERLAFSASRTV